MWWPWLLLVTVSLGYEVCFVTMGMNLTDEGWPLYAAMQLHAGGTLYRDVFFVFPPGHLLCAWLATAIAPTGTLPVVVTRCLYGLFDLALVLAIYALARRLMPPAFALLAGLCVAVAAPQSHELELLFGYRYLVWSVLALLAFERRLRTGREGWMVAAGAAAGIGLVFRIDHMAVVGAIGLGVLTAHASWRPRLRDAAAFGAGAAAAVLPAIAWWGGPVGLGVLWRELFVRPIAMTALQSLPLPPLVPPAELARAAFAESFERLLFRLPWLLYALYAAVLLPGALRALWRGERFRHALLLAVTAWGGVFFVRSLGRSDIAHLDSAIPPACLLTVHAIWVAYRFARNRFDLTGSWRERAFEATVVAAAFAFWVGILGSEVYWRWRGVAGHVDLLERVLDGRPPVLEGAEQEVAAIERFSGPDDVIVDFTSAPLLHVLTGRRGPGYADIVMPGTFLDEEEEMAFLERLVAQPPALAILPLRDFDGIAERSFDRQEPRIAAWVKDHYAPVGASGDRLVMRLRN
jgi:Dolichyl-phosphate-mannose-protein mannosyltransferase